METEVGKITHFFSKISVGVIELNNTLKESDTIHIKGATTDFKQKVNSMQIEHEKIDEAESGQSVGLKVKDQVRRGDVVYKVEEGEEKAEKKEKAPAKKAKGRPKKK